MGSSSSNTLGGVLSTSTQKHKIDEKSVLTRSMSSNHETNQRKKQRCSKKFSDLPQRVIVHKILINHELKIKLKEEKNPFLLFGFFKNDRLRNIWIIFTSIKCLGEYNKWYKVEGNLIINYSKLCSICFFGTHIPNMVNFSHRMYSLRSFVCQNRNIREVFDEGSPFPVSIFTKSRFPKLRMFSLVCDDFTDLRDWYKCVFFDHLKSLQLEFAGRNVSVQHFVSFFRAKEKIFGKNMKKLTLYWIELEEKMIVSLPNLEVLKLFDCKNLFVIPSEKKLKEIDIKLYPSRELQEINEIALNSRNASSIDIWGCSWNFLPLFEVEKFPNLKKLITQFIGYPQEKRWTFSSHLKELEISNNHDHPDFFQINEWNELKKLTLKDCFSPILIKGVKFPNLRFLSIDKCSEINDEFFEHFEGKVLEELDLNLNCKYLTGKGWNKNIFRSLKKLIFTDEFNDSFFQENEFPNLKKMIIRNNSSLKNRDSWIKNMKNLEEIDADISSIKSWKRE